MSARLNIGDTIPVALQLEDGATGLFPRAVLYKADNTVLVTVDLAHVANGYYKDITTLFPSGTAFVNAVYVVYTDAGHTIESQTYFRSQDNWPADSKAASLQADLTGILALLHSNAVVDKTVHGIDGTTTGRLRGFATPVAAALATDGAADGAEGEASRWLVITSYDGAGLIKTHRLVREL